MAGKPDQAEPPVPDAAPAPAAPPSSALITRLEAELAEARAALARAGAVMLRVVKDSPALSVTVGGVTVSKEPSPVPPHMVAAVQEGAANAGVPLEEA